MSRRDIIVESGNDALARRSQEVLAMTGDEREYRQLFPESSE